MDDLKALQSFVVLTRKTKGLTQEYVARLGRISRNTLASFESADEPYLPAQSTLRGIAKGLGVSYETLDRISRGVNSPVELSAAQSTLLERLQCLTPSQLETVETIIDGLLLLQRQQAP